jgi:hypothetical protein
LKFEESDGAAAGRRKIILTLESGKTTEFTHAAIASTTYMIS